MQRRPPEFKLIAGLGNPGKEYQKTYHNSGLLALARLARNSGGKWKKGNGGWEYAEIGGTILLRPLIFMNQSGGAIRAALAYFKISPEKLLIIHDDSDLALGKFKLVFGRGAAGHKGVESIQKTLGTKNFWRLRLGIRPEANFSSPKLRRAKAGDFVLKNMSAAEVKKIYSALEGARVKLTVK